MIRKYYNHTLHTNRWYREEEPQNINSHKISETKQLSLPHQKDCNTRKGTKYCITKQGLNTEPQQTMGVTINNGSTTTEPPYLTSDSKPLRGPNTFYWYHIFAQDDCVVKIASFIIICSSGKKLLTFTLKIIAKLISLNPKIRTSPGFDHLCSLQSLSTDGKISASNK